jgi:hypothetical protein
LISVSFQHLPVGKLKRNAAWIVIQQKTTDTDLASVVSLPLFPKPSLTRIDSANDSNALLGNRNHRLRTVRNRTVILAPAPVFLTSEITSEAILAVRQKNGDLAVRIRVAVIAGI